MLVTLGGAMMFDAEWEDDAVGGFALALEAYESGLTVLLVRKSDKGRM